MAKFVSSLHHKLNFLPDNEQFLMLDNADRKWDNEQGNGRQRIFWLPLDLRIDFGWDSSRTSGILHEFPKQKMRWCCGKGCERRWRYWCIQYLCPIVFECITIFEKPETLWSLWSMWRPLCSQLSQSSSSSESFACQQNQSALSMAALQVYNFCYSYLLLLLLLPLWHVKLSSLKCTLSAFLPFQTLMLTLSFYLS